MLEILGTFKRLRAHNIWDESHAVHLQLMGQDYYLSYIDFTLFMGIYDREYTLTDEYRNLLSSPHLGKLNPPIGGG